MNGDATTTPEAVAAIVSREPHPGGAGPLAAVLAFGWRGMLKIKHVPEQLIDVTITPVLFTLLFTYMYGGAISGSTGDYLQFLLPGTMVMSVLFTTVYSGVSLNTDVTKGVVDRFRSLPAWRPAPLAGAVLGDVLRYLLAGVVVLCVGLALGYRPESWIGMVWALLLVIVFSFALSWVFTTVGLVMRAPSAVMNTGFMALFPLIFVSNGFVPKETLPGWLETVVDVNPISHVVTAARGLMDGDAAGGDIGLVLIEAAVLAAIFAPLTTRLYRTRA
ncbi:MAG: ABC transporter permease [Thermoleophilia bacterium]